MFTPSSFHLLNLTKQAFIFISWTSFLYIGYQLTNNFPIFEPNLLPLTALDQSIPFLVWTIYPYFLLIALMYAPIFYKEKLNFKRALIAITISVLINYAIFIIYPTYLERPEIPLGNSLAESWYRWLITIDQPTNCFPSGHITSPFISMYFLTREHKSYKWPILIVFFIISLSILTTKQHYIVDLFGGLATAFIGITISKKF